MKETTRRQPFKKNDRNDKNEKNEKRFVKGTEKRAEGRSEKKSEARTDRKFDADRDRSDKKAFARKPFTDRRNDHRAEKESEQVMRKPFRKTVAEEEKKPEEGKKAPKICPYSNRCGGCGYIELPYEEQIKKKQAHCSIQLKRFGKVQRVIGMEDPLYYRNKVHHVFDHDRRGNVLHGIYQEGSHQVVPVTRCLIEDQKCQAIIDTIRDLCKSFKIKSYDEDTGYGLLRHVLVRKGFATGEIMVVLVLGSPILPSKNNFVKALRKVHPEITTVILNVNDKQTSMVLGDKETTLYGPGFIKDKICGKTFRISAKSFYQVNPVQTEKLYKLAVDAAGLTGKETVLDAYCGVGTIGLIASDQARKVIGVELSPEAVADARINARENHTDNIRFYVGDAGEFMENLADGEMEEKPQVVFMDPPRSGSSETFIKSLVRMAPEKIVYVSCNPDTLARDLGSLTKKGYEVQLIQPVDMFPATEHVETVCLLSRK